MFGLSDLYIRSLVLNRYYSIKMEAIQPCPLRGDGAYDYYDTKPDHLIGRSKFEYVFRGERMHDQKIAALIVSK